MVDYHDEFNPEFEKLECSWCGYPLDEIVEFKEVSYFCTNKKCSDFIHGA